MSIRQHVPEIVFILVLAVLVGCAKETSPPWYRAEKSSGSRYIGYGKGPDERVAFDNALGDVFRQRFVTVVDETEVQQSERSSNGRNTSTSYARRYLKASAKGTLRDVKPHKTETVDETVYTAVIFNDVSMSQKIGTSIRARCQSYKRALRPSFSPNVLRKSVKFARDIERETRCRDYKLAYHEGLWQVVVGGERELLSAEDLVKYFFPKENESTMEVLDEGGRVRSTSLTDGDKIFVRHRVARRSKAYPYWLYIDALGRVVSLDESVDRKQGTSVGSIIDQVPMQVRLDNDTETHVTEYILRLACDDPLPLTIRKIGDDSPPIGFAAYYKLGEILDDTTDSCGWSGLSLAIGPAQQKGRK